MDVDIVEVIATNNTYTKEDQINPMYSQIDNTINYVEKKYPQPKSELMSN